MGATGTTGAAATGPTGGTGPAITFEYALIVDTATRTIPSGSVLPLDTNVLLPGPSITHTAGSSAVNLTQGTYLVYYSIWAVPQTAGNSLSVGLLLNGVLLPGGSTTTLFTVTNNARTQLNQTVIITIPAGTSTLEIFNAAPTPNPLVTAPLAAAGDAGATMSIVRL